MPNLTITLKVTKNPRLPFSWDYLSTLMQLVTQNSIRKSKQLKEKEIPKIQTAFNRVTNVATISITTVDTEFLIEQFAPIFREQLSFSDVIRYLPVEDVSFVAGDSRSPVADAKDDKVPKTVDKAADSSKSVTDLAPKTTVVSTASEIRDADKLQDSKRELKKEDKEKTLEEYNSLKEKVFTRLTEKLWKDKTKPKPDSFEKLLRKASYYPGSPLDVADILPFVKNIDERDSEPKSLKTALHWAVATNDLEKFKLLTDAGARWDITDALGNTAFDLMKDKSNFKDLHDFYLKCTGINKDLDKSLRARLANFMHQARRDPLKDMYCKLAEASNISCVIIKRLRHAHDHETAEFFIHQTMGPIIAIFHDSFINTNISPAEWVEIIGHEWDHAFNYVTHTTRDEKMSPALRTKYLPKLNDIGLGVGFFPPTEEAYLAFQNALSGDIATLINVFYPLLIKYKNGMCLTSDEKAFLDRGLELFANCSVSRHQLTVAKKDLMQLNAEPELFENVNKKTYKFIYSFPIDLMYQVKGFHFPIYVDSIVNRHDHLIFYGFLVDNPEDRLEKAFAFVYQIIHYHTHAKTAYPGDENRHRRTTEFRAYLVGKFSSAILEHFFPALHAYGKPDRDVAMTLVSAATQLTEAKTEPLPTTSLLSRAHPASSVSGNSDSKSGEPTAVVSISVASAIPTEPLPTVSLAVQISSTPALSSISESSDEAAAVAKAPVVVQSQLKHGLR